MNDLNKELQLVIWRPCKEKRTLYDNDRNCIIYTSEFREPIYSWYTYESVLDSIIDEKERNDLSKMLKPHINDKENNHRLISELNEIVLFLDKILANQHAAWGDSKEPINNNDLNYKNYKIHRVIALRNHIDWAYNTFKPITNIFFEVR